MENFNFLNVRTEPSFAENNNPAINPLVYYEYAPSINDLAEYMALMNFSKTTRISKIDVERLQYVMGLLKCPRVVYIGAGELFFMPLESSAKCYWVRFTDADFASNTITVEIAYACHSIDLMKKSTKFLSECMNDCDVNQTLLNDRNTDDLLANYTRVMKFFSNPSNSDIPIHFSGFVNSCEYDDASHVIYRLPMNILWKAMREEHAFGDGESIFSHALQDA